MKPVVVITSDVPAIAVEILSRECEVTLHSGEGAHTEDEVITILSDADAALTTLNDPITRRVLEANPNLRVIANYAVGYNNIDVDAAREAGVVVTNTPGVLTDATADLTMALILAVTRRIVEGDRMVREGRFSGWHPLMLLGSSLQGKRLGIVGMGRIGLAVARRAHSFGMRIAYFNPAHDPVADSELGAERLLLIELLETSDVVSIHVPLTPETHHLIGPDELAQMKKGAYLVNSARGPIVDEAALAKALVSGHLGGAGLDVYENEPEVHGDLLGLDNVVLLPHLGSATVESRDAMATMAAQDILAVLHGQAPRHPVT
jgi:glyoxylate reductase